MDWTDCDIVEVIPAEVSGVPLIRGTRMPADQVIESLSLGQTIEEIAHDHQLRRSDVARLLFFQQNHQPQLHWCESSSTGMCHFRWPAPFPVT